MYTDKIRITPQWGKGKEQIWAERFEALEEAPKSRIVPFYRRNAFLYVAAAIALIILALPSTAFLYTKQINTACGEHKSVVLPDGSNVEINADSQLKYKPLWWAVSRNVELTGEAFFEVEKGSRFDVRSGNNTVSVLGTSFNVYARGNAYNVSCLTGKVCVSDKTQSMTLTDGWRTKLTDGVFVISENKNNKQSISWTKGEFSFTAMPLNYVIEEIERQYNIKIEKPRNSGYLYTGAFSRKDDPRKVLEIIGKPFDLKLRIIE